MGGRRQERLLLGKELCGYVPDRYDSLLQKDPSYCSAGGQQSVVGSLVSPLQYR